MSNSSVVYQSFCCVCNTGLRLTHREQGTSPCHCPRLVKYRAVSFILDTELGTLKPCPSSKRYIGIDFRVWCSIYLFVVCVIQGKLLVSWCFEPSQPQRITSGLSIVSVACTCDTGQGTPTPFVPSKKYIPSMPETCIVFVGCTCDSRPGMPTPFVPSKKYIPSMPETGKVSVGCTGIIGQGTPRPYPSSWK